MIYVVFSHKNKSHKSASVYSSLEDVSTSYPVVFWNSLITNQTHITVNAYPFRPSQYIIIGF